MNRSAIITTLVTTGLFASVARADVIRVPGDYPTIQAAADAASAGDEIVLASGTYRGPGNRDVQFHGKPLTVRSATRNPADVVIRCDGRGRAFELRHEADSGSVFEGLHVVDGNGGAGESGGAMLLVWADVEIVRCHFTNNTATEAGGGVIRADYGRLVLRDCRFRANRAGNGGAILSRLFPDDVLIVDRCEFLGNAATHRGGAIHASARRLVITNSVFSGNEAGSGAGGLHLSSDEALVANCVITGNTTPGEGGGIVAEFRTAALFVNSIIWGNEDDSGTGETAQILRDDDSTPVVLASCVQGTWTGEGFRNIDDDPRLVDPDGPDGDPGTLDDNCRLRAGSPCIDAGLNLPIAIDFDGNRRIADDPATADTGFGFPFVIDMGMHEYGSGPPCPGDTDGSGSIDFDDLLDVLGTWGPCR